MLFRKYTCFFYETPDGKRPVEDFIKSLGEHAQDKFIFKKELLGHFGPDLRYPHTKNIGDGIFELRFKSAEGQIRILFFFFCGRQIVLLHGFVKKKQKTPKKEIKIAKKRMRELVTRK
jgi:phage-related protein